MKKNLLTTLMCLCTIFVLTACGEKENSEIKNEENETVIEEIDESDDSYDLDEDEELAVNEIVDPVSVILYSELTGSSYRITVDRNKVFCYHNIDVPDKGYNEDNTVFDNNIMDDDRLDYLVVDRDEFTNDSFYTSEGMANSSYNSSIKDVEWRKERGYKPSSDYSEEWTDCLSVYEYNEIEYTVNYISNGNLDVYVRNPYTEVYDLRYAVNAGKDNPDYLKFAEDFIDRIEFID